MRQFLTARRGVIVGKTAAAPQDEDISSEELQQALDDLVQDGQLKPREAAQIMKDVTPVTKHRRTARRCRGSRQLKAFKDEDQQIFKIAEILGDNCFDGHFTVMRFTSNWRMSFGNQPNDRQAIDDMASGYTLTEAFINALEKAPWDKRTACSFQQNRKSSTATRT